MSAYSSVQTDLFALTVLFLIGANLLQGVRGTSFGQKLYWVLAILNAAVLAADSLQFLLPAGSGFAGKLQGVSAALVCGLPVLICFVWVIFVCFQIRQDFSAAVRTAALLALPAAAVAGIAFFSWSNSCFFIITAQATARHGKYFWIYAAACIAPLVWAQFSMLKNRKRLKKRFSASFYLCVLPPLIGAALHPLFPGPSPAWPCMTFSLLLFFLNFQRGQLHTDHLTGLYNRWHLDGYLRERTAARKQHDTLLAGIMTDLDSFKCINDRFGHIMGDHALVDAGNILRASVRSGDFVCRYGGDEFIVIVEVKSRGELERIVARIRENVAHYNYQSRMPFLMSLSLGYDVLDPESGMTSKQFLRHIDQLMYQNKKCRKQQHRSVIQGPADLDSGRQAPQ